MRSAGDLAGRPGVVRAERLADGKQELYTPDADALVRELVTSGTDFQDLEIRGASLEEAFEQMVAHGHAPERTTPGIPTTTDGARL